MGGDPNYLLSGAILQVKGPLITFIIHCEPVFRQDPSHVFSPWEIELQTTPINHEAVGTWTLFCQKTVGLFKVNLGLFSYIILTPVFLVCFEGQIPVDVFQSLPNTL